MYLLIKYGLIVLFISPFIIYYFSSEIIFILQVLVGIAILSIVIAISNEDKNKTVDKYKRKRNTSSDGDRRVIQKAIKRNKTKTLKKNNYNDVKESKEIIHKRDISSIKNRKKSQVIETNIIPANSYTCQKCSKEILTELSPTRKKVNEKYITYRRFRCKNCNYYEEIKVL